VSSEAAAFRPCTAICYNPFVRTCLIPSHIPFAASELTFFIPIYPPFCSAVIPALSTSYLPAVFSPSFNALPAYFTLANPPVAILIAKLKVFWIKYSLRLNSLLIILLTLYTTSAIP